MRRVVRAVILAAIVLAAPARATDRLEPLDTKESSYRDLVESAFHDAFAPEVRVRAIVYVSSATADREFAVGLAETGGRHNLFVLTPGAQLLGYAHVDDMDKGRVEAGYRDARTGRFVDSRAKVLARLPPREEALRVGRCEVPLPRADAQRTVQAWREMLLRVRKPDRQTYGLDGRTYVYAMQADGRTVSGETWSPDPRDKSLPGLLVAMTYAMRDYCLTRRDRNLHDLKRLSDELLARVGEEGG